MVILNYYVYISPTIRSFQHACELNSSKDLILVVEIENGDNEKDSL